MPARILLRDERGEFESLDKRYPATSRAVLSATARQAAPRPLPSAGSVNTKRVLRRNAAFPAVSALHAGAVVPSLSRDECVRWV
jgi:hypothetical protein